MDGTKLTMTVVWCFRWELRKPKDCPGPPKAVFWGMPKSDMHSVPVDNDRLNMLVKYRGLFDLYGQTVDGISGAPCPSEIPCL